MSVHRSVDCRLHVQKHIVNVVMQKLWRLIVDWIEANPMIEMLGRFISCVSNWQHYNAHRLYEESSLRSTWYGEKRIVCTLTALQCTSTIRVRINNRTRSQDSIFAYQKITTCKQYNSAGLTISLTQ